MHYDIFISYKRNDKEKVFPIKDFIERNTGMKCWIDMDGIESDAQFADVIIKAINNAQVFLFMYSNSHTDIEDYANDWTIREINFAQKKNKRIVFVNIDKTPLTDWFELFFGSKQQVEASSDKAMQKLCVDLKKWIKEDSDPKTTSKYEAIPFPETSASTQSSSRPTQRKVKTEPNEETPRRPKTKTKEPQLQGEKEGKRSKILMWIMGAMMTTITALTIMIFALDFHWPGIVSLIFLIIANFFLVNVAFILQIKQKTAKSLIGITMTLLFMAQLVVCCCICGHHLIDYTLAMMCAPILIAAMAIEAIIFAKLYGRVKWINIVLAVIMFSLIVLIRFCVIYNMGYYGAIRLGLTDIAMFIIIVLAVCTLYILFFRHIKSDHSMAETGMESLNRLHKRTSWIITGAATMVTVIILIVVLHKTPVSVESMNNGDVKITVKGVSYVMKFVEEGTFQMGLGFDEGGWDDEDVHTANVSNFYMGETEVTQELWNAVMGCTLYYNNGSDNLPMESVSWHDCQSFIKRLNKLTGRNFRLPTEAEWEYAARGGNKSKGYRYSGSDSIDDVAWYDDYTQDINWLKSSTRQVKNKLSNELGLYDMSGNVQEWCLDSGDGEYVVGPYDDLPSIAWGRVIRGGSWFWPYSFCQVNRRSFAEPEDREFDYGFRLVLVQ